MPRIRIYILLTLVALLLTGCYNHGQRTPDAWDLTEQQLDSISFSRRITTPRTIISW